jgi:hypothetical protein
MKFTVLMMMPYDWHSDQGCAADCVLREWVEAETVENALQVKYPEASVESHW